MNATAIAQHLNVAQQAIVEIQEWTSVLWVRVKGLGARFVSKKVVRMDQSTVQIRVKDTPSKSKGWGRYQLKLNGRLVESVNGKEFISSKTFDIEAAPGDAVEILAQVQLVEGRYKKRSTYEEAFSFVVAPGKTADLYYRPGSQGITLEIENVEGN